VFRASGEYASRVTTQRPKKKTNVEGKTKMGDKQLKQIRGQLRQIVKELLPEVMAQEIQRNVEKQLTDLITERLNRLDEKQKEMFSYIIRMSAPKV